MQKCLRKLIEMFQKCFIRTIFYDIHILDESLCLGLNAQKTGGLTERAASEFVGANE